MGVKENIKKFAKHQGISISDFEKSISVSNGYVNSISKSIGVDKLNTIIEIYSNLNIEWLLTGKGKMIIDSDKGVNALSEPSVNYSKGVPYYDVDFIGGFDLVLNDQTIQPNYYIDFAPFNDADCWVNVTGKSMSPFISHGDLVALKEMVNWKDFLLSGEIYAIITDDFRTIKIVKNGGDKNSLLLIPYNKSIEFEEQPLPKRLVKKVFAVKGSIKKFF